MSHFINPVPGLTPGRPIPRTDYFNAKGRKGYNPNYSNPGDPAGHKGVDLGAAYGSPLLASHNAVVHNAGYLNSPAGYGIELIEEGANEWWGTRYLHMPSTGITVTKGQAVTQGQRMGDIGQSGKGTKYPHTHFEIRRLASFNPNRHLVGQGTPLDPLSFDILDGNVEQVYKDLQVGLQVAGYYTGTIDGQWGPMSKEAYARMCVDASSSSGIPPVGTVFRAEIL